jgi:hypothetical protein
LGKRRLAGLAFKVKRLTHERHAATVQRAFAHLEKLESEGEQSEPDPEHCSFVQSTLIMKKNSEVGAIVRTGLGKA